VFSPRGSQWVSAGQLMIARGSTADPEFQVVAAPAADAWTPGRQPRRVLTQSRSAQRVPQGVYGSEDWTITGTGSTHPITATSGSHRSARLGAVSIRAVGVAGLLWLDLGQRRSLGLARITMAAGSIEPVSAGCGTRAYSACRTIGRRPWSASSASAVELLRGWLWLRQHRLVCAGAV